MAYYAGQGGSTPTKHALVVQRIVRLPPKRSM